MATLVIIPTYNEVDNLGPLIERILLITKDINVLVVDDASPDGTGVLAEELRKRRLGRVEVIHRSAKLGLATAYLAGFRYGITQGYDFLVQMDADLSHDPCFLPVLLDAAQERGADLVIGSRYIAGGKVDHWPWYRRAISEGGSWYARTVLGVPVLDLTGGYKVFRRDILERLDLSAIFSSGYGFQIEMTYRVYQGGGTIIEVPIAFRDRKIGVSKMSPAIFVEALGLVLKLRAEHRMHQVASHASSHVR
jgi:dolichol-phosphate mannosyltransferase